jgi:hypothetical protein
MQDGSYSRRAAAERSACGEALFDHGLVAVWHRLAIFHLRIAVFTAGAFAFPVSGVWSPWS